MNTAKSDLSVLQKVMKHDYFKMPTVLRRIYGPDTSLHTVGSVKVVYGKNPFAWLASFFLSLPAAGTFPLEITVKKSNQEELFKRVFPNCQNTFSQYEHKGTFVEKHGLFHFKMTPKISERTLLFNFKRQYFFFIPLPRFISLQPHLMLVATDKQSFHINSKLHFLGFLLAEYSGMLSIHD